MLGMRNYPQEYIDACRSRVDSDLTAYRSFVASTRSQRAASKAFEATFFNNMMLLLDTFFVHRLRTVEGKDGNPLNEVRVMCDSMLHNNSIMSPDKTIKLSPERSILKYRVGDEIKMNEDDFLLLSKAFFAEIESKYLQSSKNR
jgi:hypothetical protein